MKPSFDPGGFHALTEGKHGLEIVPLPEMLRGPDRTLRIAQSKSALKKWRRVYEFKNEKAELGRKEIANGNGNR